MILKIFLNDTNWNNSKIDWFDADWSVRSYARLTNSNNQTAILLKSPPDNSPDAMIGHLIGEWSYMNSHFKSLKLNVPTIHKEDLDHGFILMDDFGNDTIIDKGLDAYIKATDILITMRDNKNALNTDLIRYEDTHVYKALRFYPEFIINNKNLTKTWFDAWKKIEESLPPCPRALTHIDFAGMNLMWKNNEIGIIDFQAACNGPFVYDIVNLLEDIRHDIPNNIKQSCKNHYCAPFSPQDRDIFNQWYTVITAQFYARILGQIKFLSTEKGRNDLMKYYDNLEIRFEKILQHAALTPILRLIKKEQVK